MTARTKIAENWRPKMAPAEIKMRFPLLDPEPTMLAFIAYHLEKDDTSANWDATFYGWCDWRQRQAAQGQSAERLTDSMGFPLKPGGARLTGHEGDYGRRFLTAYNEHIESGMTPEEARLAAERDLEGAGNERRDGDPR